MTLFSGHPARRPWACLLLLPFLAACDSVTAPEAPAPPVDALDGASVSASAVASNERFPIGLVVPADVCPGGNERIVVEGFQHALVFSGPTRTGVHFNPSNLRGESVPSGHKYVATGPSQRTTVEARSGVTVTKQFSVIFFLSGPGPSLKLWSMLKMVIDPDGDVTTEIGLTRAECV